MNSAGNSARTVKLTLTVDTGEELQFELFDSKSPQAVQCVYAVLRTRLVDNPMRASYGQKDSKFCIIYIGETNDLARRIEQHRNESWFVDNGATHICFREEADQKHRSVLRSKLVRHYAPDCNHAVDAQADTGSTG